MGIKKVFVVLFVSLSIIFGLMLGSSYAWYSYNNAESTLFGRTLLDKPTVIFAQDDSIVFNTNTPILDSDRYSFANITSFNVTFGENLINYDTSINILLEDINIDSELINGSFKYELMENGLTIVSGDFSNYQNDGTLELLPTKIIQEEIYPKTYVYDLFIWLSDDGTSQNELMDKKFSARVKVNNAIKRK